MDIGPEVNFFVLNSIEHEFSTAHKTKMLKNKIKTFLASKPLDVVFINVKMPTAIVEQDKFHAQLS